MTTIPSKQQGFTIIELIIATTIFSVILLVATTGIMYIGKLYYKGITEARTQEATRKVSEEVGRSIQFADGFKREVDTATATAIGLPGDVTQFCVGDTRYTFKINEKVTGLNPMGLKAKIISPSDPCANNADYGDQLLGNNMRLLNFEVAAMPTDDEVYDIKIKIAYGDDDLLSHYDDSGTLLPAVMPKDALCKSGLPGGSFCATAGLDTTIKKRLN